MKKLNFNIKNRKVLTLGLCLILVCIFTLTIAYAALNTVLTITGNAEVVGSTWDVHLDNVKVTSGSVSGTAISITNPTTATFTTTLNMPGDFYEFTIDVVNNGTIDAMIDGITKTPTLTSTQAKYLNYIIEYQNGESINTKQLVSKNSFVRLKVRVEFRKDINASDLPTTSETLNLAFTVNYVQSDGTGSSVTDNGLKQVYKIVSGDLKTPGSEISIGDENFYVMYSDDDAVTMLAKMGITTDFIPKQSIAARDVKFSSTEYWISSVSSYPAYVYNSNSLLYSHIENYKTYLESLGAVINEARLMKYDELTLLGYGMYMELPEWLCADDIIYWFGTALRKYDLCHCNFGGIGSDEIVNVSALIRPVIILQI